MGRFELRFALFFCCIADCALCITARPVGKEYDFENATRTSPLSTSIMAQASIEELTAYFATCGLSPARAAEGAKSKQAPLINALFRLNSLETKGLSDKQAQLASQVARDGAKLKEEERKYVLEAVIDGKLKAADQVTGQSSHCKTRYAGLMGCA